MMLCNEASVGVEGPSLSMTVDLTFGVVAVTTISIHVAPVARRSRMA